MSGSANGQWGRGLRRPAVLRRRGGAQGWLAALALALAGGVASELRASEAAEPAQVSFSQHIRPLLTEHCLACHGGVKQAAGLSLVTREQALADTDSGGPAIVPGDVEGSPLWQRVTEQDPSFRMPPAEHGRGLAADELELLRRWIEQGADWELHWSLVAPTTAPLPEVRCADWPRRDWDRYVLARIEQQGWTPAAPASRRAWLRRVTLDLTGLPPTPAAYAEFLLDNRPEAAEQVVDRLLASPHFGERWASMWLDLARYADTMGYEKDPHRDMWPYRDWVIRAFNADVPFDEFTVKQLAGDLLPHATLDDRIASSLHRNTQTNTEGGTDDEEFRVTAVLDRVNSTWQIWQATTFGCVQCHAHPYDPYRHEEYYRFLAMFNTSRDEDVDEELPRLRVPLDRAAWDRAQQLDDRMSALRRQLFDAARPLATDASAWQSLEPLTAAATGQTRLETHVVDGVTEVRTTGTITAGCAYELTFALPEGVSQVAAVRIEALPEDLEAALRTPEMGFVVTRLTAHAAPPTVGAEGGVSEATASAAAAPQEIAFDWAWCDEPEPTFDPIDSLRDNGEGWGAYTRQSYPRQAVFVLREPLPVPAGSRLHLQLQFGRSATGAIPLVIRRGRFAIASDARWGALLVDEAFGAARAELETRRREREAIPAVSIPTMAEQDAEFARRTYVFQRGNWLDKGAEALPGTPSVLPALPRGEPVNRLSMARWLAAPENPRTARVLVNRIWQELFGVGLVETAEDFGSSGTPPSHPELLDALAVKLQGELGWSVKGLLREIVLSATYGQDARATPAKLAADPRNRLLARGPRTRLTAEMIRDQALVLSGLFSPKQFGPPVMPPQPEGVWRTVYSGATWQAAEGEDRYRRAVYTYWKRTSGYPSLLTFDAPSRDVCVARRIVTNTPLQALATLNDEAYVELAQGLAQRMATAAAEPAAQIDAGYGWALGESPAPGKRERLLTLYREAAEAYDADPAGSAAFGSTREAFALTAVANALLNLDEVLTK